jgi:putative acetyltransferase
MGLSLAMSAIRIREAVHADLSTIMEIFYEAVHGSTSEHYDHDQRCAWAPEHLRTDEEHWKNRLADREILIGVIGGASAGFCAFTWNGHIDLLFTHPAHARCGVGGRLLEEAEIRMRRAGTIQAHTGASRISRPVFERLGYRAVSEELALVRGVRLPQTNMEKFL